MRKLRKKEPQIIKACERDFKNNVIKMLKSKWRE